jgi:uncharacterized membrane protein YraQ (UPF0718 family)
MDKIQIKNAAKGTANAFKRSIFILIAVLLLIALIINAIPQEFYGKIFSGNEFLDSIIGAFIGSISAGNPINSYVLGGGFLEQGVSLVAVTAFILTWATVGMVQLPAESVMLGKKFAIYRNVASFVSAIVIAISLNFILQLTA